MENILRKGEITCSKQFLLFSQCFLYSAALMFLFKCTLKCRLQFVSIWNSLKFCHLVIGISMYWLQWTSISHALMVKEKKKTINCEVVR